MMDHGSNRYFNFIDEVQGTGMHLTGDMLGGLKTMMASLRGILEEKRHV